MKLLKKIKGMTIESKSAIVSTLWLFHLSTILTSVLILIAIYTFNIVVLKTDGIGDIKFAIALSLGIGMTICGPLTLLGIPSRVASESVKYKEKKKNPENMEEEE